MALTPMPSTRLSPHAAFDGNQVYSIYSDCNDIYNVVKAMPTFDATKWVCPLWGDQSPQQVEGMVDGAVILCLIATALWLFASSVVHRRASVIAQQVEDEQKLFDSLGHVGPGEGATAPGV